MDVEAPTIVQVGDPVLRAPTAAVDLDAIRTPETQNLIQGMVAAMHRPRRASASRRRRSAFPSASS